MQIPSRFTIAIHIMTAIDTFQNDYKVTSDFLAGSINVNPVIIRRTMQALKGAGLIEVRRGTGGMEIARPMKQITLLDIFNAVEPLENGQLFHFHENPNTACPVGRNIHAGLDDKLFSIQAAMEDKMKSITLEEVIRDTQSFIARENN
ncbi:MAG: Rrf2 family transcriptional regulator [Clostridiales bacterium]|nr:Rrf2 family transcriptional regulator [Clostridiales bacterium]